MESSSQKSCTSSEDDRPARCPVLGLLLVSDKGMVFESSVSFAVGCSIELAVHVSYQKRHKGPATRRTAAKSEFITSEGLVVSCARRPDSSGAEPVYEVTLLFASLQRQDRRKLRHLANAYRQPMRLGPEGLETLCEAGGREPCLGLN
jgi:hypothetical protein